MSWRRLSRALLAASLLTFSFAPAGPVLAAAEIPGTLLTRPTIQGLVGGSIVDEVYELAVPSGSVVIVTIRGEEGAELGIYLFDAGAESILTDTPIAASAKPGGRQVISHSSANGGILYLDVNGRNRDRSYQYILTVSTSRDTSPPELLQFSLPTSARSSRVCATVKGRDGISGVREVGIRDAGNQGFTAWMPYRGLGDYCVVVEMGDGPRRIETRVRNGVGLTSAPQSLLVTIDDTAPSLKRASPAQGGILYEPRGIVTWTFDEVVRMRETGAQSVYAVDQRGATLQGVAEIVGNGTKIAWTPNVRVPVGSVLLTALTEITDVAGNPAPLLETLELFRKQRAEIEIVSTAPTSKAVLVRFSTSANLLNKDLVIETYSDEGWGVWSALTVGSGTSSIRVPKSAGSAMRIRWTGDDRVAPIVSRKVLLGR